MIYLDTSALVKLVATEAESPALRRYLGTRSDKRWFTAALTRTELIRAVSRTGEPAALEHARTILTSLDLVALSDRLLDAAATLAPAIDAVVTYDDRMATAVRESGMMLAQPAN